MSEPTKVKFKNFLMKLITPTAIGILFTIVYAFLVNIYYTEKDSYIGKDSSFYVKTFAFLDRTLLDVRFLIRGPRKGSDRVAVLAVDEKAVSGVGRWPWPRWRTAEAIDKTFKLGAKVITTDMVFSEASDRPEMDFINTAERYVSLDEKQKTVFQETLEKFDYDKKFGETVATWKDRFILGNFSVLTEEYGQYETPGYADSCYDILFDLSDPGEMWRDAETRIAVMDDSDGFRIPQAIREAYSEYFRSEIEKIKSQDELSASQRYQKLTSKLTELVQFCDHKFLNAGENDDFIAQGIVENWDAVKDKLPEIKSASFNEWIENYKSAYPKSRLVNAQDWVININDLWKNSTFNGYFNAFVDPDGKLRTTRLFMRTGTTANVMPSIAFLAYLVDQKLSASANLKVIINKDRVSTSRVIQNFEVQDVDDEDASKKSPVPIDKSGKLVINYAGPRYMFPHVSLADVLDDTTDKLQVLWRYDVNTGEYRENTTAQNVDKATFLKDKVLVLGATAIGIFDLRNTAFDENFPGVETHANIISNLLTKDFLVPAKGEETWMPLSILIGGSILTIALSHIGALFGFLFMLAMLGGSFIADFTLFFTKGTLISIALPLFFFIFLYLLLTTYKYFTEERSKRQLKGTFSKYVSPAIVDEVLKDPKNLELGGRKERVTVFFSDVRGFTTISEKLDPRALSDLLNSYLTPMTDLVFKNKGTLDKYMGDAIMAFFGAPVHYNDHAKYACRCALQNLEKLKELQAMYAKKGLPQIDIGIGLNTGECSVGNMGSETVRNYTVMGDAVNLASRLEGINKTYGTRIIISEFTYEEVKNDFVCREVDWVRVKGKLKPVKIYELIAEGKAKPEFVGMVKHFSQGYEMYHQKQFDKAIQEFEMAIKENPQDETSKIYIERCQEFIAEPPPADWDGVYVMKTK